MVVKRRSRNTRRTKKILNRSFRRTKRVRKKKYSRKSKRRKTRNQRGGDKLEYLVPATAVAAASWVSGNISYNNDKSITVNGNNIKCGAYCKQGHGWAFDQPDGTIVYIRPEDPSDMTDLLTKWGC
jgi:hypothetical protein